MADIAGLTVDIRRQSLTGAHQSSDNTENRNHIDEETCRGRDGGNDCNSRPPILGVQAGSSALAFSLFERQHTPPAPVSDMPVQQVQQQGSDIVQVQQLQDQIRQLNGRIEDMSYQLLQMQETIRKAQEDNEFRFQELEKKEVTQAPPARPARR
ncbi:hypothetical protein [Agrobacterium vitis]|uniref:hypothetical protein n=1 Tax=Agrobacterium vitis TaxID=373 RepID=UPI003D2972BA